MLEHARQLHAAASHVSEIANLKFDLSNRPDVRLLDLLIRFRRSKTTDPRDKVYSLIGVAKDYDGPQLNVDHTAPWQKVYRDTAIHILYGTKSVNFLSGCNTNEDLPSWVPNWLDPIKDHALHDYSQINSSAALQGEFVLDWDFWNAGGDTIDPNDVLIDGNLMTLPGIRAGRITEIFPGTQTKLKERGVITRLRELVQFCIAGFENSEHLESLWDAQANRLFRGIAHSMAGDPVGQMIFTRGQEEWTKFSWQCYARKDYTRGLLHEQITEHNDGLLQYRSVFKCELTSDIKAAEDDGAYSIDSKIHRSVSKGLFKI